MKKLCFIIPYFGHFPNYFQLFLKSCAKNEEYNWLIITDNKTNYQYPPNVRVIFDTFANLKKTIQSKFDFEISLNRPYKLCDYRPAYGYLFSNLLKDFEYWGYCDSDTIMGDLNFFLTDELLRKYDKLFCLGHMTIYKNSEQNNTLFMSSCLALNYKHVMTNEKSMNFDEEWTDCNINRIFLANDKYVYMEDLSLNLSMSHNHFRRIRYVGVENTTMPYGYEVEKEKKALYLWDNGQLYRLYMENGILKREDFLYMHMQKRVMRMDKSILQMDKFKIVPDEFLPLEVEKVSLSNFMEIKKTGYCRHTQRLLKDRIIKKIHKILHIK